MNIVYLPLFMFCPPQICDSLSELSEEQKRDRQTTKQEVAQWLMSDVQGLPPHPTIGTRIDLKEFLKCAAEWPGGPYPGGGLQPHEKLLNDSDAASAPDRSLYRRVIDAMIPPQLRWVVSENDHMRDHRKEVITLLYNPPQADCRFRPTLLGQLRDAHVIQYKDKEGQERILVVQRRRLVAFGRKEYGVHLLAAIQNLSEERVEFLVHQIWPDMIEKAMYSLSDLPDTSTQLPAQEDKNKLTKDQTFEESLDLIGSYLGEKLGVSGVKHALISPSVALFCFGDIRWLSLQKAWEEFAERYKVLERVKARMFRTVEKDGTLVVEGKFCSSRGRDITVLATDACEPSCAKEVMYKNDKGEWRSLSFANTPSQLILVLSISERPVVNSLLGRRGDLVCLARLCLSDISYKKLGTFARSLVAPTLLQGLPRAYQIGDRPLSPGLTVSHNYQAAMQDFLTRIPHTIRQFFLKESSGLAFFKGMWETGYEVPTYLKPGFNEAVVLAKERGLRIIRLRWLHWPSESGIEYTVYGQEGEGQTFPISGPGHTGLATSEMNTALQIAIFDDIREEAFHHLTRPESLTIVTEGARTVYVSQHLAAENFSVYAPDQNSLHPIGPTDPRKAVVLTSKLLREGVQNPIDPYPIRREIDSDDEISCA